MTLKPMLHIHISPGNKKDGRCEYLLFEVKIRAIPAQMRMAYRGMHTMHFELRNLRHFVALINHRSFVLAAHSVNLSQPAFSRSIQALEHQVGCELVHREKKGLPPTQQGKVLLDYANEILRKSDELTFRIAAFNSNAQSVLNFGCGPVAAASIVPKAIAKLLQNHPHAKTRFVVDKWNELSLKLNRGEIDFFISNTLYFEDDKNHQIVPLAPRKWCLYAHAEHPVFKETPNRYNILKYPIGCTLGVRELLSSYLSEPDYIPSLLCENGYSIMDISLNSHTIGCSALLPMIEDNIKKRLLRVIEPSDFQGAQQDRNILNGIISLKGTMTTPLRQTFIQLLQDYDQVPH
ncbi:LysR family transcriptional regulator [Pseudomonas sp. S31]|uniref:LysR family transcriptional regulator n=1 Tax=Pseudomonas sp. S31 TaxID=1564473 RepID=UPI001913B747|nr:LysR family transcriptional regulator [Pseudomonas sp. S31]